MSSSHPHECKGTSWGAQGHHQVVVGLAQWAGGHPESTSLRYQALMVRRYVFEHHRRDFESKHCRIVSLLPVLRVGMKPCLDDVSIVGAMLLSYRRGGVPLMRYHFESRSSAGAVSGVLQLDLSFTNGFRSIMAMWSCSMSITLGLVMPAGSGVKVVKVVVLGMMKLVQLVVQKGKDRNEIKDRGPARKRKDSRCLHLRETEVEKKF